MTSNGKGQILAVDDTPASLKLLTELLRGEGYDVRAAINGDLALQFAVNTPPELILLDVRMPGMDGFEVCRRLKQNDSTRSIPVIFVTSLTDTDDKVQGFGMGAVDFITKPYQRNELLARVRTHLEVVRLRTHLEDQVAERTKALSESQRKMRETLIAFVGAMASTIEIRDPYTAGHQRRVGLLAMAIAKRMKLTEDQVEGLYLAAIVHDFGKIRVPTELLCKPGHLSESEFTIIKEHVSVGYDILKTIDFPWPIADIVHQHHERLDGSGYPLGLGANRILPEAKILAVADVVEAMTSHRPYRPGLGLDAALAEIRDNRGKRFDPAVVDACLAYFDEGNPLPA